MSFNQFIGVSNALTEASGVWKVIKKFPRTVVKLAIPVSENPAIMEPGVLDACIDEVRRAYPKISKMEPELVTTPDFGRVLVITVTGRS